MQLDDGTIKDASVTPQVWTAGRVEDVVVMVGPNGLRLVKIRVVHDRTPELGDKFSNRHGQKGTIGMMLRGRDMPRSVDGLVPDLIMNPHAIPSRMTIGQLFEQLLGKVAANLGAIGNATPFMNEGSPHEVLGEALEALGMERTGNEILYDGQSGKQVEAAIFMGPLYVTRLKHMTEDKWNARGAGRKEQRTHQPTGGRGNQGGLKIGEMDRDTLISHGIASFTKESMMERSDAASFIVCNGCGTIPIYNESQNFYMCSLCDGPVNFIGDSPYNLEPVPPTKRSTVSFSKVEIPYATKLFMQEMDFFMNMSTRILTTKDVARLPAVEDVEEAVDAAAADIDGDLAVRVYQEILIPEIRKAADLPTSTEIESQVAALEEEQKKIMEEEIELRRRKDAIDAGLGPGTGVNAGLVEPVGTIGVGVGDMALGSSNMGLGSSNIGPSNVAVAAANPFNNMQTSFQANPFNNMQAPVQQTANPFNNMQSAPAPLQPTPGMSVIPAQQSTAAPTFIISTTDEDLKRDGFVEQGVMPTMPLGQPDMQAQEQAYPRRTIRRTKPAMVAPNPFNNMGPEPAVSQTPHSGGYDNNQQSYSAYPDERAMSAPGPSPSGGGGIVKVEKLG
jgi:hypothetical protein